MIISTERLSTVFSGSQEKLNETWTVFNDAQLAANAPHGSLLSNDIQTIIFFYHLIVVICLPSNKHKFQSVC